MEFTIEKQDNGTHNKIKGDIMVNLMNDMFLPLSKAPLEIDVQAAMDIILSCLIMFSREVLVYLLLNSNMLEHRSSLMDKLFNQIKLDVNELIKQQLTPTDKATH
jgi:energy-converting hydrogenase A subunit M